MRRLDKIDQQRLDKIAEEFSVAIRAGEDPSVNDFLARYTSDKLTADSCEELRSLLSSVAMIEGMKQSPVDIDSAAAVQPRQLDDYTVVREIGRGGMGIVYEAIHQSLGRRVAVKVLSHSLLDQPKHLARFRREARAAARLRHSNIVPVFGVGQDQGQHYFVMDFIRGMSLREWLLSVSKNSESRLPIGADSIPSDTNSLDYFRWVAQLGATVADALQYAHSQGILHRDIKPGNLLLDQNGTVWIADFGLAKLTEQDATMTGDIVGTPQYMAPESFECEYHETSETYCVGLTLYELLTKRPAIDGKNTSDTIRLATQGVNTSPRKWNQRIPRDLETIILKSLSLSPQDRYGTASEMRDDLQCFLADRPIAARRTGPVGRLIRWSRREPAIAALTLGIFASLLALTIVAGVAYWKTKHALVDTQIAKNSAVSAATLADEQRILAQSNLQVAIAAFDEISQRIADRSEEPDAELLGDITDSTSPTVTQEDVQLLQTLLTFFDELATTNRDSLDLKSQAAAAKKRVGDIYHRLGQYSAAELAYRDALDQYHALSSLTGPTDDLVLTKVKILNDRAAIAGLRGKVASAIDLYDQTADLLKQSARVLESPEGRYEYARANSLFASIATRSGWDIAARFNSQGRRPIGRIFGRKPLTPNPREEWVASTEAVDALISLTEEFPDDLRFQMTLARALRTRANASLGATRAPRDRIKQPRILSEIRRDLDRSIEVLDKLHQQYPESTSIQYELAKTLSVITFQPLGQSSRQSQRGRLMRSQRMASQLLSDAPETPRYMALKAHALDQFATVRRIQNQRDEEKRLLLDQLEIQKQLLRGSPELSQYQIKLAQTIERLVDVCIAKQQPDEAIRYLTQATEQLQSIATSQAAHAKLQHLHRKLKGLKDDSPSESGSSD